MTRALLIFGFTWLMIGSAFASHTKEFREASAEDAKMVVNLDWYWVGSKYGKWSQAWEKDYHVFHEYAWWQDRSYPRLELHLQRLAAQRHWTSISDITEEILRGWQHLEDAKLGGLQKIECIARNCIRFKLKERLNCIAFVFHANQIRRQGLGESDLVSGYYCASMLVEIPADMVDTIIKGIEVRE